MTAQLAMIKITNLRVRTFVGFNDEEREKQQDVVINAEICHRVSEAVLRDEVDAALNYKAITKAMIAHVEQGRFLLLEKLTGDLLEICSSDSRVITAAVTVDKPHALRFADSVSVTMTYDDTDAQFLSEMDHDADSRSPSHAA